MVAGANGVINGSSSESARVKRPGPWCGLQGSGAQIRHSRGPSSSTTRLALRFGWLIVPLQISTHHEVQGLQLLPRDTPTNRHNPHNTVVITRGNNILVGYLSHWHPNQTTAGPCHLTELATADGKDRKTLLRTSSCNKQEKTA